jgi:hypothetical protein
MHGMEHKAYHVASFVRKINSVHLVHNISLKCISIQNVYGSEKERREGLLDSGCAPVAGFFIYHLTPWSRVFPEKLTCPKLLKKLPAFYETQRFITVFTTARHLSIS